MTIRTVVSRAVAGGLVAVLCAGAVSGCTSDNVSCTTSSCTVKLNRGVDTKASVLGVDVTLIEVKDEQVVLDVGGTRATLPSSGAQTQVGGLTMKVNEVTGEQVVLDISRGGDGG
jgi:hypothetical protein